MGKSVLYMSMSLDGFIAGPNERIDNGLGDGGMRLHRWLVDQDGRVRRPDGVNGAVWDEFMTTGAVVTGHGTRTLTDGWSGDHHDGVPLFFVDRDAERLQRDAPPRVTYLQDVAEAMDRAREAAGDRDVLVHGVGLTRRALAAGALDELHVHLIPVLLGQGRRLFEDLPPDHVELERLSTIEGEDGVTHLRYRVVG
jgi:dihydrofolate reductase